MRALWIQPRSATGVGVGRVNFAKASGFDADGINRKTILFFTGFPSKLENDGAGRRRPPKGAGTLRRQNQRRRESREIKAIPLVPLSFPPAAGMTGFEGNPVIESVNTHKNDSQVVHVPSGGLRRGHVIRKRSCAVSGPDTSAEFLNAW